MEYLKTYESFEIKDKLKEKLLSISEGTIKFGADTEEEIEKMLSRGILFENVYPTKKRGVENQCHRNVATFYQQSLEKLKKSHWKIMNGYAFGDGEWVAHTWLENKNSISETVKSKFSAYFGYILTPEESEIFVEENM